MSTLREGPEAPLAEKMRPKRLEDIVGQDHLLGPDSFLPRTLNNGRIFSVISWATSSTRPGDIP